MSLRFAPLRSSSKDSMDENQPYPRTARLNRVRFLYLRMMSETGNARDAIPDAHDWVRGVVAHAHSHVVSTGNPEAVVNSAN
jgi:hypothetical protein